VALSSAVSTGGEKVEGAVPGLSPILKGSGIKRKTSSIN